MHRPQVYQRAIELGPEMELRVWREDGSVERARVREQLTIGRCAASALVIDDPGVNLIHARVVPGIGGSWELRCVGGARLTMDDAIVDRVNLELGMRFAVGETWVECAGVGDRDLRFANVDLQIGNRGSTELAEVKSEIADVEMQAAAPDAATVEMPRLLMCPTCFRDMTAVAVVARFCPTCGSRLPARDGAGFLIPPEESSPLFSVYQSLREELEGKLAGEAPQVASSLIILAYANAMLNLGWRYEHGRGALRNVEEAARCYAKAGKLSQAWGRMPGGA